MALTKPVLLHIQRLFVMLQVCKMFGLNSLPLLYKGSEKVLMSQDIAALDGCTLTVGESGSGAACKSPASQVVFASNENTVLAVCRENPTGENQLNKTKVCLIVCAFLLVTPGCL